MFLIAIRLAMVLAAACLLGLIFAWIIALFSPSDDGGWDDGNDEPKPDLPPNPGKKLPKESPQKRFVQVDESYYLAEFDLRKKK